MLDKKIVILGLLFFNVGLTSANINHLRRKIPKIIVGSSIDFGDILKGSAVFASCLYVVAVIAVAIDSTAETISSLSPKDKSKEDHAPKKTTAN